PPTEVERQRLDPETVGFLAVLGGRVPDGRALYAALDASLRPASPRQPALPPNLAIAPGDAAEVTVAGPPSLPWVDAPLAEPAGPSAAWSPERMEYGFSLAARTGAGETVLTAGEYFSGRLDWHDFDVAPGASLRADEASHADVVRTAIPAPVSYRGMPATRF